MDEVSGFCIKQRGGYGGGNNGGCGGTGTKCGRWNPTTEQVKVLTNLFRSGLRTPSTDQIQKISSQLSFYGKIESKNVFYWFQNHKARERQKRHRFLVDEPNEFHHQDKLSSTKCSQLLREHSTNSRLHFDLAELNQVSEPERVLETLPLFPLDSFREPVESEKCRFFANDYCKENSYNIGTQMDHPALDLRLSFL